MNCGADRYKNSYLVLWDVEERSHQISSKSERGCGVKFPFWAGDLTRNDYFICRYNYHSLAEPRLFLVNGSKVV